MRSKKITLLILLIASYSIVAQQKITLEEIWTGAFRTKGMDELHALKNTNQYTVLDFDRASRSMQIDLYDFETLEKVTTLINTKDFSAAHGIPQFQTKTPNKAIKITAVKAKLLFNWYF